METAEKRTSLAATPVAHEKMRELAARYKLGQNYIINIIFEHWDQVINVAAIEPLIASTKANKPKKQGKLTKKGILKAIDKLSPEDRELVKRELRDEEAL